MLFVADAPDNQILMYNPKSSNPKPLGSITDGVDYPLGLAVDKQGTLYVANFLGGTHNKGSIVVYPAGSTSPSLTITNGVNSPYGIGVDSQGDIFATNVGNNVMVGYKAGATSSYESVSFPPKSEVIGVGIDSEDNVWLASDSNSKIYEVPAGSTTFKNARLSHLSGPIGIAFGEKNEMFVSNYRAHDVTVYAYGTTTPAYVIKNGIEPYSANLNGVTHSDYLFQSNEDDDVVGYKFGATAPFSTITGIADPRGIASTPLVVK